MIPDSSAVVAVYFGEPGFEQVVEKLANAADLGIGAPTAAEAAIVVGARLACDGRSLVHSFLREQGVAVVAFGEEHWRAAAEAYERLGRGRHRAKLNFGDCLSFAVAKLAGEPLLAVGHDFPAYRA